MAHELTRRENGIYEMAYVGQSPWHELGTYLGDEQVTGRVMMAAAGIDWSVETRNLLYQKHGDTRTELVVVPDHVATVRADTQDILGVVSRDYKLIQQHEAFEFVDKLIGEAAAMYETAGSLKGGRRVWGLVKLPHQLIVTKDDVVGQYLLFVNGHDGGTSFRCGFTTIRVVCDNTCSAAVSRWERGVTNNVSVRHMGDISAKIDEARRILGMSLKYFEVAGEAYRAMSHRQINEMMLQGYFEAIFPTPQDAPSDATELRKAQITLEREKTKNIHHTLATLFEAGRGSQLVGVRGTLWGAFNAVTEYVDHVKPAKKDGTVRKGGFETALFGQGEAIKQRAFDEAVSALAS